MGKNHAPCVSAPCVALFSVKIPKTALFGLFLLYGMVVEDIDCSGDLPGFILIQEVNFGNIDDPVFKGPVSFILATLMALQFHSFVPISQQRKTAYVFTWLKTYESSKFSLRSAHSHVMGHLGWGDEHNTQRNCRTVTSGSCALECMVHRPFGQSGAPTGSSG